MASCQEEKDQVPTISLSESELLSLAQKYYQEKNDLKTDGKAQSARISSYGDYYPVWEKSRLVRKERDVLIVPFFKWVNRAYGDQNYIRRLVFEYDSAGELIKAGAIELVSESLTLRQLVERQDQLIDQYLKGQLQEEGVGIVWSDVNMDEIEGIARLGIDATISTQGPRSFRIANIDVNCTYYFYILTDQATGTIISATYLYKECPPVFSDLNPCVSGDGLRIALDSGGGGDFIPCPDLDEGIGGPPPTLEDCEYLQLMGYDVECITDEDPCITSKEDLKKAFPEAQDTFLNDLEKFLNKHGEDFGLNSKVKMEHFLSQAAHESTNYLGKPFSALEENLNYRWKKLGTEENFVKYFNPIINPTANPLKANPLDFKKSENSEYVDPVKFANYVYNRIELGNTSLGDGYKYRGRGIFQLTGKENYEKFNSFYNNKFNMSLDLINNPELISNDIELAVVSALWYYQNRVTKALIINESTDVEKVTKLINGGKRGLKHRKELFEKVKSFINCI